VFTFAKDAFSTVHFYAKV